MRWRDRGVRQLPDPQRVLRALLIALIYLSLVLPLVSQQSSRQTPAPQSPHPGRKAFTFVNYELEITLQPPRQSLAARGTISLRNDSKEPQDQLALQVSSSLKWAAIRQAGTVLQFTDQRIDSDIDHTGAVNEAVVKLSTAVQPGGNVDLAIGYQGVVDQQTTRLDRIGTPAEVARRSDWDRITSEFTGLRGVGYVIWYPVAIEPALLGDGNRIFTLLGEWKERHENSSMKVALSFLRPSSSRPLLALSNAERSHTTVGDTMGAEVVTEHLEYPRLGLEVPTLVIAPYKSFDVAGMGSPSGATPIGTVWFLPGNDEVAGKCGASLSKLEPFIRGASRRKIALVQLPGNAMSFESNEHLFLSFGDAAETSLGHLLAHTVAHGALESWRPWIAEGSAHYSQTRFLEQQMGREAAMQYLEQRRAALAIAESPGGGRESLVESSDEVFYRTKAMFVWWMLRDMLGEDVLRRAMRKYRSEVDKEPSYVQRLLQAESKKDLEWFFSDWIYRDRGLPEFRVTAVNTRDLLDGGHMVAVTVENSGTAGAEVPIRVRTQKTDATIRLLVPAEQSASARLQVPQPPVEVTVNDGSVPETDPSNNTFTVQPK